MTAPWKAYRTRRATAVASHREAHRDRREARSGSAAVDDALIDAIVLMSVLMFFVLAVGVGLLALPVSALTWAK
jgi:hypothetical protein